MGDGLDGGGVVTGEIEGAAFERGADAGCHTAHHCFDNYSIADYLLLPAP